MNHYYQTRNFKEINISIIVLSIILDSSNHLVCHSFVLRAHISSLVSSLGVAVAFDLCGWKLIGNYNEEAASKMPLEEVMSKGT